MINLEYLNKTVGNNKAVQQQILGLFLSQSANFYEQLQEHYEKSEFTEIENLAHKVKNSFAIVGASEQSETLKSIELIAREKDPDKKLPELIAKITNDSKQVFKEVEELMKQ